MELCVLRHLGWSDPALSADENEELIAADVNSLPPSVAASITLSAVGQCASDLMQDAVKDPQVASCAAGYTANQLATIQSMAAGVFSFKCFEQMLETACHQYVEEVYIAPFRNF